jgi:hypothetical protein
MFDEAAAVACESGLPSLQGDVRLSQAFIFFRQKDYSSSDQMFHDVLGIAEQVDDWYYHGHAL